jgi:YD repeat-containing protein
MENDMKNSRMIKVIGLVILIGLLGIGSGWGQDRGNQTSADNTLRGSGRVNSSTLGMEFDLPLGSYSGRGINVPISLSYSSKNWRMEFVGSNPIPGGNNSPCYKQYIPIFSEKSASGWTSSLQTPYIEYLGAKNYYNADGTPYTNNVDCPSSTGGTESYPQHYLRRLIVHLPSGETHELRPDDTVLSFPIGSNCNTNPSSCDPNDPTNPNVWNTTYYAIDGSGIKYQQNSDGNLYRLLMPDGSFYDFDHTTQNLSDRKATKFTDRNGNFTSYNKTNGNWTDTLGRNIINPVKEVPSSPSINTYSMLGMTGTYKFNWKQLKGSSATESGLTNFNQNLKYYGETYICNNNSGYPTYCTRPASETLYYAYPDARIISNSLFNPIVLSEIELPNGQKYKFGYDVYGRIEKISYPTGGEEFFQYAPIAPLTMLESDDGVTGQTNFGVINRKVYKFAGDTTPYEWTYQAQYVSYASGYKVTINNPDDTKIERYLHRGFGSETAEPSKYGYDNGLAGMAYEERGYNSLNQLVSKKLTTWNKTQFSVSANGGTTTPIADWHPRVTQEDSIIYDPNGSGVSTTSKYEYEGDLNQRETPVLQKKSMQYAFVTAGSALPSLPERSSETTFLQYDTSISQTVKDIYKNQNMLGLATATVVKDKNGNIVSRSEMKYDEAGLSPNVGRGNPTTSRTWDSTKGLVTNQNAYLSKSAKFDIYGNQIESTDAKGNTTITEYDATYHAYPIKVTTPIPDPTGQKGSNTAFETTTTYNMTTGLPLTTTDANGQTTTIEYDPVTLRPTRVIPPTGAGIAETIYHDEVNNAWVKTRKQIDANNWAESISYFDGLGRNYKAEEVNSQGNIFVEKEFDQDGRVKRVTNPYRTGEAKQWATNVYDEQSRVIEVILPDGAKVKTDYGVATTGLIGLTKQITDQALKKRRSITNALGQLIRVDEPDANGNLGDIATPNQPTYYVYDILSNLTTVKQGGTFENPVQTRTFVYDSLSRLKSANNPESGIINYDYDNNGNLTSKTDARNVVTTYIYDNLNRVTNRNYAAPTGLLNYQTTPNVTYKYDNLTNAKGKLISVANSVSETKYLEFDTLGRITSSQQITDGIAYNPMTYTYNLSGALVEQKYPSGKIIRNFLDQEGDLSRVVRQGKTFASDFNYTSAGAVSSMKLV